MCCPQAFGVCLTMLNGVNINVSDINNSLKIHLSLQILEQST